MSWLTRFLWKWNLSGLTRFIAWYNKPPRPERDPHVVQIIGGVKYDTSTATKIHQRLVRNDSLDEGYVERLYRKKSGKFFTVEPNPRYAGDGDVISPLSDKGARLWCEAHLSVEKYELVFGKIAE